METTIRWDVISRWRQKDTLKAVKHQTVLLDSIEMRHYFTTFELRQIHSFLDGHQEGNTLFFEKAIRYSADSGYDWEADGSGLGLLRSLNIVLKTSYGMIAVCFRKSERGLSYTLSQAKEIPA